MAPRGRYASDGEKKDIIILSRVGNANYSPELAREKGGDVSSSRRGELLSVYRLRAALIYPPPRSLSGRWLIYTTPRYSLTRHTKLRKSRRNRSWKIAARTARVTLHKCVRLRSDIYADRNWRIKRLRLYLSHLPTLLDYAFQLCIIILLFDVKFFLFDNWGVCDEMKEESKYNFLSDKKRVVSSIFNIL